MPRNWPSGLQIAQRILGVQEALERLNLRISELVSIDGLTGVRSRRSFDEMLQTAFSFATHQSLPLSLVMLDVDQFKPFNETFGHPAGDSVLRTVADIPGQHIRALDVLSQYVGEEFAILLPGTEIAGGRAIAERLR